MSYVEGAIPDDGGSERPRVLVVEDSGLIASKIVNTLEQHGYWIAGPAATLAQGLRLAQDAISVAVLDIGLRGKPVYPLAQALCDRRIPFMFLTGYHHQAIPEAWRAIPRVDKPFDETVLLNAVQRLCAGTSVEQGLRGAYADQSYSEGTTFRLIREGRNLAMESRIIQEQVKEVRTTGTRWAL